MPTDDLPRTTFSYKHEVSDHMTFADLGEEYGVRVEVKEYIGKNAWFTIEADKVQAVRDYLDRWLEKQKAMTDGD